MKRSSVLTALFAIAAFAFMLTACNSGGSGNNTSAGDPAAAAKTFFDALYGGTASDAMFCSANAASVKTSMDQAKQALTASGATIDASGLKYEVANQSGDTANVKVSGKLKMTVSGASNETDYTPITVQMKNEGGAWKVCGMTA